MTANTDANVVGLHKVTGSNDYIWVACKCEKLTNQKNRETREKRRLEVDISVYQQHLFLIQQKLLKSDILYKRFDSL